MLMKLVYKGQLKQKFLDKECKYLLDFSLLFIHDFSAVAKMSGPGNERCGSKDPYEWTRGLRSLLFS
jgi:hypothetical protein